MQLQSKTVYDRLIVHLFFSRELRFKAKQIARTTSNPIEFRR